MCYNSDISLMQKGDLDMSVCTFFGHKACYQLDTGLLCSEIEKLIHQGVDTFYVGNQGQFDSAVYRCLKTLRSQYQQIHMFVVLAYLPIPGQECRNLEDTMYPEIEGHPKFAITRRNRWMIAQADYCLCYVNQTWGGAYQFAKIAKEKGLTVINLGNAAL